MQDNERLFEEKYNLFSQMVYNICYSFLRVPEDAEDIMQDSFIEYFHSNKDFSSLEHEKYFLIRVTINNCKNHIRKYKRIVHLNSDYIQKLRSKENVEEIDVIDLIEVLTPKYKEVIILKYAEDMSNKEISIALKISEDNVRKRLERALKTLKESWEE